MQGWIIIILYFKLWWYMNYKDALSKGFYKIHNKYLSIILDDVTLIHLHFLVLKKIEIKEGKRGMVLHCLIKIKGANIPFSFYYSLDQSC